ncbi:hypothetical protein [Streptomyces sp. NBC_00237]|uniref:hypothetical protein n=1 Tax=Streptomyces sp. NBC_00237 TaxID=2975687 RepID=UPI002250B331|nr:hypothetical protein [Streptomyces sp. NBC_00237]
MSRLAARWDVVTPTVGKEVWCELDLKPDAFWPHRLGPPSGSGSYPCVIISWAALGGNRSGDERQRELYGESV